MEFYSEFIERCCECGNSGLLYDEPRGEIICKNCGLVVQSKICSHEPEWRAYTAEEERIKSRAAFPTSSLDKSIPETVLGGKHRDSYGKTLNKSTQTKYNRLSQVDERIQNNTIRNFKSAILELKRIKSHLNLSNDLTETAGFLYRLALDKKLIKGRSVIGMVSAALYLACRKKKVPLTIKDIAEVTDISNKDLGRSVRVFLRYINISDISPDPVILIDRLGEKLGLTMYTRQVAIEILRKAEEKRITIGKTPMTLAASTIFIATVRTGERRTQQQVAEISRTTPVTIRNRVRELVKVLEIDNFKVKRGAGAKSVVIKNPNKWVKKQRKNFHT